MKRYYFFMLALSALASFNSAIYAADNELILGGTSPNPLRGLFKSITFKTDTLLRMFPASFQTKGQTFYVNYLNNGLELGKEQSEPKGDRIWVIGKELCVKSFNPSSIVRVFSRDGVIQKQQILLQACETKIMLPRGIYIVTLNNNFGKTIHIE